LIVTEVLEIDAAAASGLSSMAVLSPPSLRRAVD
jgi:hypothetical protein